jgi:GTP cyclohydrolase IB
MNAPERVFLPDVQASPDVRALAIDRVGVKGIRHPINVARADGTTLATVAMIDMYVGLSAEVKGTHMSRFLEILAANHEPLDAAGIGAMMKTMLVRLEASAGYIQMRFPFFVMKRAPVSGVESLMDYEVIFRAEVKENVNDITLEVVVPVTSLCPCSKKISEYGAHNQRSHVTIAATATDPIAPETLIAIAEAAASCEVYGILKRPDEKYVTERAYDNPKFVEDLVRDVATSLKNDARVLAFRVESENFESIHNHSAYAMIEQDRRTM